MKEAFFDDWVDVSEMSQRFPETFKAPSDEELEEIKPDYTVKISNGMERFFVLVHEIYDDLIVGEVNNKLVCDRGYNSGDLVIFHKKNVYCVHSPEYLQRMAQEMNLTQIVQTLAGPVLTDNQTNRP
jgi:lactate dehydrogenase-like 2-hydroxyacid dehydrogenase